MVWVSWKALPEPSKDMTPECLTFLHPKLVFPILNVRKTRNPYPPLKFRPYAAENRGVTMKTKFLSNGVALFAVTVLLSACATTQTNQTASLPRFREEAASDVVVQFPGWSAISITKPNTDEGRFRTFFNRTEAEAKLANLPVRHNMAVISYDFNYSEKEQAEHQQVWGAIFKKLGYKRVVFVCGKHGQTINGAFVVKDMALTDQASSAAGGSTFANTSTMTQ
jgi:hypothetical protein